MTPEPPPPPPSARSLEQLPPELIEKILLYVVGDVTPPIAYDKNWDHVLRCHKEILTGSSHATPLLAHRLVSRTLRDNSWRALAGVVGETIFDLRSKNSVENLITVTRCRELSPWVHKLTISCFVIGTVIDLDSNYTPPEQPDMDEDIRTELKHINFEDGSWHASAWGWVNDEPVPSASVLNRGTFPTVETQPLVELLGECFESLHNLSAVHYHYDDCYIPGRFRLMANHYYRRHHHYRGLLYNKLDEAGNRGAFLGQFILIEALAKASTKLNSFQLAALLRGAHCFHVLSTTETIVRVLKSVEHLVLRDEMDIIPSGESSPPTIAMLTTTYFPNLRSLTLEAWRDSSFSGNGYTLPLPELLEVPDLENLTIVRGVQSDRQLLNFLQLFRVNARTVTLKSMQERSYAPILGILKQFKLDRLTICDGKNQWWDEDTADQDGYRGVPKGMLESLAKYIDLGPPRAARESGNSTMHTATE
jgi:hypothetical protein